MGLSLKLRWRCAFIATCSFLNLFASRSSAWIFPPETLLLKKKAFSNYSSNSVHSFRIYRFRSSRKYSVGKLSKEGSNLCNLASVQEGDDNTTSESQESTCNQATMLMSLKWVGSSTDPKQFSKVVTDVWRWKDAVLGDGNDYFIPKPRTLSALQSYLMENLQSTGISINECAILSNCARFEILLVQDILESIPFDEAQSKATIEKTVESISELLNNQVHYMKNRQLKHLQLQFDWPRAIDQSKHDRRIAGNAPLSDATSELSKNWNVVIGVNDVANHLCHIAAGMASHPRHTDREVVFRPFSSRDAHILLQLKRTLEISMQSNKSKRKSRSIHSSSAVICILLRYAIQAGKAARNPEKVPLLRELRRKYGTGNSKFDGTPPSDFIRKVTLVSAMS
jgi:hypothetical protein